jgi:hypothetical protein
MAAAILLFLIKLPLNIANYFASIALQISELSGSLRWISGTDCKHTQWRKDSFMAALRIKDFFYIEASY